MTHLNITSPTTSSMTAALTSTDPTRVSARLTEPDAELITAKVVPDFHQQLKRAYQVEINYQVK